MHQLRGTGNLSLYVHCVELACVGDFQHPSIIHKYLFLENQKQYYIYIYIMFTILFNNKE